MHNEIKDTIKVIGSLVNRGTLLKGTTGKTNSQEGGSLHFLVQFVRVALPSTKNVLIPLVKSALIAMGLKAGGSATDEAIQKKTHGPGTRLSDLVKQTTLIISNEEIEDENS